MKLRNLLIVLALCILPLIHFYNYIPYFFNKLNPKVSSTEMDNSRQPLLFISYWVSWATQNPAYILRQLCEVPNGVNIVMLAFVLEKPDNSGLTLQMDNTKNLAKDILNLQARKIKVFISTGGALGRYPWRIAALDDKTIANQYIQFVKEYHIDGIDFDIEKEGIDRLPNIINQIKEALPDLMISLTVGSQGVKGLAPLHNKLAQALYSKQQLNFINLMNYDHFNLWHPATCSYESLNVNENCYIQNIEATKDMIQSWTNSEKIAKQLISNGIMYGYADDKRLMSPQLMTLIVDWLQKNGYGAVMSWDLNRDQASCEESATLDSTTGMVGVPIGVFTNAIINQLKKPS